MKPPVTFAPCIAPDDQELFLHLLGIVLAAGDYRHVSKAPIYVRMVRPVDLDCGRVDFDDVGRIAAHVTITMSAPSAFPCQSNGYVDEVGRPPIWTRQGALVWVIAHELQHVDDIFDGIASDRITDALRHLLEVRAEKKALEVYEAWRYNARQITRHSA